MWSSNRTPTSPWRGAQSVPRQLKLKRFPEGLRLVQQPVSEIEGLRDQSLRLEDLSVVEANRAIAVAGFRGDVLELRAEIEVRDSSDVGFRILQGPSVETLVGFTAVPAEVYVDRTKSGEADFHESFAGRHSAAWIPRMGPSICGSWSTARSLRSSPATAGWRSPDRVFPAARQRRPDYLLDRRRSPDRQPECMEASFWLGVAGSFNRSAWPATGIPCAARGISARPA